MKLASVCNSGLSQQPDINQINSTKRNEIQLALVSDPIVPAHERKLKLATSITTSCKLAIVKVITPGLLIFTYQAKALARSFLPLVGVVTDQRIFAIS